MAMPAPVLPDTSRRDWTVEEVNALPDDGSRCEIIPTLDGQRVRAFRDVRLLALAVEIPSSSTTRADRNVKRRLFASEGVPEYGIVDPAMRLVERWRPYDEEPEVLIDTLAWRPVEEATALAIDLREWVRAVLGE